MHNCTILPWELSSRDLHGLLLHFHQLLDQMSLIQRRLLCVK